MDHAVYDVEARIEAEHWWFRGRRQLFAAELAALKVGANANFLDVGTGTGTNLRMLRDEGYGRVSGVDLSPDAVQYCASKGFASVQLGDAMNLPWESAQFDVAIATDTIEHVPDDAKALREMHRVLVPGGHVLIAVPAFPSLWGLQDEVAHHLRRYRMRPLVDLVCASGFEILRNYHFNYLLFAPIWAARQALRVLRPRISSENEVNSPGLNRILAVIFSADVRSAPILRPPFGVSILVLARKAAAPAQDHISHTEETRR